MGLNLYKNQVSDIQLLRNLTELTDLLLGENQISDFQPLQDLKNLTITGQIGRAHV